MVSPKKHLAPSIWLLSYLSLLHKFYFTFSWQEVALPWHKSGDKDSNLQLSIRLKLNLSRKKWLDLKRKNLFFCYRHWDIFYNSRKLWCNSPNFCKKSCKSLLKEIKSKDGNHSRRWPEGSLFDSYYSKMALLLFLDCSTLPLIHTLYCWVLSKEASSTIFWVFGMTQHGIEPRSPKPLVNTLTILPMSQKEIV